MGCGHAGMDRFLRRRLNTILQLSRRSLRAIRCGKASEADVESARINAQEGKTAEEMHIPMPYPTIKPMIVAGSMVLMFCGLMIAKALLFVGAALMVYTLYSWLLSPLEPEHH